MGGCSNGVLFYFDFSFMKYIVVNIDRNFGVIGICEGLVLGILLILLFILSNSISSIMIRFRY